MADNRSRGQQSGPRVGRGVKVSVSRNFSITIPDRKIKIVIDQMVLFFSFQELK